MGTSPAQYRFFRVYIPQAIREQLGGSGAILVGGSTILSLVLAGIALGWLGLVAVVGVTFLLVVIEVWREAAAKSKSLAATEAALESSRREADTVPGLRAKVEELESTVAVLEQEMRRPRAGPEETLEALTIHLERLTLVLKHRAMSAQVPAMPVTRAEIEEDGTAELSGVADRGVDLVQSEPLAVMKVDGEVGTGFSQETRIDGVSIQGRFDLSALPSDLASAIERRGSLNPQGYMLVLAGLAMDGYQSQTDADLQKMQTALTDAVNALTRTLVGLESNGIAGTEGSRP
ncbi:MAG TPA: hypothetical protein VEB65_02345 [Solirubrobacterales bacterium]|nr:hypothetical protein [Solirubrobacterales bacterium]